MKKALLAVAAAAALTLAVVLPLNISANAAGTPVPAAMPQERGERHPEIRAAMRHLEQARDNLQKGAHDFGGHRAKALEHTNHALEECRLALESDRK